MDRIKEVRAGQILNSRKNPTVEAVVSIGKFKGKASVPSGISTGEYEAVELSVKKAISSTNNVIAKKIIGKKLSQKELDNLMIRLDGTKNKSKLGANATLAVSLAFARAASLSQKKPLYEYLSGLTGKKINMPAPFLNIIEGGRHASNNLMIQEFMIVPKANTFKESMKLAEETYQSLKKIISKKFKKFKKTSLGDEGGFAPNINAAEEALDLLEEATNTNKIKFAIDAAASEMYKRGRYVLKKNSRKTISAGELTDYYLGLIKDYKIVSLEDPFEQDKFKDFAELTKKSKIQVVGDDLLVTNFGRIKKAAKLRACNCLLLKPNQIGTLTEAIQAANIAQKSGWKVMVSHRGGETTDSFIADLAMSYGQIKAGAPLQKERRAKYNRLLEIEKGLRK